MEKSTIYIPKDDPRINKIYEVLGTFENFHKCHNTFLLVTKIRWLLGNRNQLDILIDPKKGGN